MRNRLVVSVFIAVVATLAFSLGAAAADASSGSAPPTARVFRPVGGGERGLAAPQLSAANLSYNGGQVFTAPSIFLIYWGREWSSGFSTGGYSSARAQTYVNSFFGGVGASSWLNSTTQYCRNIAVGRQFCAGQPGEQSVTNPAAQLAGTWIDTTSVPRLPSDSAVRAAAARGASHFGYRANALYMVLTPHGKSTLGFGIQWCAYHDNSTFGGQPLAYANIPYQPDAGASCGMNFVNGSNDAFGHGYFDGFSIVTGHEYAEAITDAFPSSTLAWVDSQGAENGDKCAWGQGPGPDSAARDVRLGAQSFAVQSLWSNLANAGSGGCVIAS
jgi:serine protease